MSGANYTRNKMDVKSDLAKQWEGFGTALKPAHEPIILARKPLSEKTIVENVLKHGTGAIDIDGCRIPTQGEKLEVGGRGKHNRGEGYGFEPMGDYEIPEGQGRFPANIICTDDALNDGLMTKGVKSKRGADRNGSVYGKYNLCDTERGHNDSGSKSRYFDIDCWAEKHGLLQFPKASKRERNEGCEGLEEKGKIFNGQSSNPSKEVKGVEERFNTKPSANHHPTVKPVHLMSWLVRLVSKEGDTVLDPFMGSGTTGVACKILNRNFIGIELNEEYIKIAEARINAWELEPIESTLF